MNRVTRNLAVVVCAVLFSAITVSVLLFFEARSGQALFGYALAMYFPAGAIAAGAIAAAATLACALLLRVRPMPAIGIALFLLAAGAVYAVQSTELTLSSAGRVAAHDPASFLRYFASASLSNELQFTDTHTPGSSSAMRLNPGVGKALPQSGAESDAQVQAISSGVQGVVASQDVGTNVAAGGAQRIAQLGDDIHNVSSNVQNHGGQWITMALQVVGFSIGGLVVYWFLRSRPYCEHCDLLLSRKGTQTRYFDRLEEINGSVEDVLAKAKSRRLQLAIQAHGARGAAQKGKITEFASTIRVSLCLRCHTHRMDFRAMRKGAGGWKEIPVLGYASSSYEPIEISG